MHRQSEYVYDNTTNQDDVFKTLTYNICGHIMSTVIFIDASKTWNPAIINSGILMDIN